MFLIPLFLVFWMPDSHISDVYLACKRKNIQITLQNVSQAYFPSNSTAHAVSFVLFLTKMYSTTSELFKEWLENLESLLLCEDKNERQTCTHSPWIKQPFSRNETSISSEVFLDQHEKTVDGGDSGVLMWEMGHLSTFAFTSRWELTAQHIRKGSSFVILISSCCCKEQS